MPGKTRGELRESNFDDEELALPEAPVMRLNKDIKAAIAALPRVHARYMVDVYYQTQGVRKRLGNQMGAAEKDLEPTNFLKWSSTQFAGLEGQIKRGLDVFSQQYRFGNWLRAIHGIGPVISTGLLTVIDWRRAEYAGNVWSFAGLNPSRKWLSSAEAAALIKQQFGERSFASEADYHAVAKVIGQHPINFKRAVEFNMEKFELPVRKAFANAACKQPHSPLFKVMTVGHAGSLFVRTKGSPKSFYGPWYERWYAEELERNERGEFAAEAAEKLRTGNHVRNADTVAALKRGRLTKNHCYRRAIRRTVKLFLSHCQEVAYTDLHGKPPARPYAEVILKHGDKHRIEPPHWPGNFDDFPGKPLRDLYE